MTITLPLSLSSVCDAEDRPLGSFLPHKAAVGAMGPTLGRAW